MSQMSIKNIVTFPFAMAFLFLFFMFCWCYIVVDDVYNFIKDKLSKKV